MFSLIKVGGINLKLAFNSNIQPYICVAYSLSINNNHVWDGSLIFRELRYCNNNEMLSIEIMRVIKPHIENYTKGVVTNKLWQEEINRLYFRT